MFPRANFATKDVLFAMKGNVGSKVCPIDKRDDEIVFTKRAFQNTNISLFVQIFFRFHVDRF